MISKLESLLAEAKRDVSNLERIYREIGEIAESAGRILTATPRSGESGFERHCLLPLCSICGEGHFPAEGCKGAAGPPGIPSPEGLPGPVGECDDR